MQVNPQMKNMEATLKQMAPLLSPVIASYMKPATPEPKPQPVAAYPYPYYGYQQRPQAPAPRPAGPTQAQAQKPQKNYTAYPGYIQ